MITFSEEYLRRLADIQNEYNLKELVMLPEDEPRFIIDLDTRKIILPDEFKFLAVENDHNAETIYFEIDRYYDKQDLSQKTCIVQYKNTSDTKAIEGFYPVTKLDVDTVPGKILFGWTIENKVTVLPGSVDFSIRFYSIDDSGRLPVFTYNINTLTGSLPVIDTLNTSNQGVEVIPGKVESLTAKFEALAKQAESNVLFSDDAAKKAAASAEESKANADAAKASASEAAKNAQKATDSADKSKTQADRAQSEADRAKAEAEAAADRADKAAAAAEGMLTAVEETVSKALTDITHTGAAQTQAVTRAGEQAVQEVDAAAQAGVGSVEQAQKTATQAVQTAATAAIQQVEQTGSTQVQAVTAAGAEQVQAIETAAAEKLEDITQLAGEAAASATKAEQAAQRAEDAATAASAIIDDTAIADSKTWSSKGIVDVLCPPIQATGNPVVCHPVEGYPLGVSVDFAPIQEGEGDPSPENVRPIKARESVDVVRCGVNLCPHGTQTFARYYWKSFGYFLPSGTYTFSATVKSDDQDYENCLIYFFDTKNNKGVQTATIGRNIRTSIKVSVPGKFDAIYLYSSIGAIESSGKSATFSDIQLEIGDTPSAFAPYTGQITSLTLPAPCYGGELDAVTGAGRETWKLVTLDGTENWRYESDAYFVGHSILSDLPTKTDGKCSHFIYHFNYGEDNIFCTGDSVYTGPKLTEKYTDVDEWKAYLAAQYAAGTPIQIAYKVATPTTITATGGKPIPALAGTNTLLTDGDSLTVTGRADPTHEIQQLRAAVVALGGTI